MLQAAPAAPAAPPAPAAFCSAIPFGQEQVRTAALYCSDGRFGDHIELFLHRSLRWPCYDRLAVPGGPGCISGQLAVFWEDLGAMRQLEFLVREHELAAVALIGHADCAFYRQWLGLRDQDVYARQLHDLEQAAQRVRRISARLVVGTFFATPGPGGVEFMRLE